MMATIIPQIVTTTNGKEHNTELFSYNLMKNRQIFINGEINSELAASVITQLSYLNERPDLDVYLFINSPGGSVTDGMAIYDYIKYAMRCDVNTIGTGMAASMGAFLLAAGTKGKRYATNSCQIMIHQPLGGVSGQATDITVVADHIMTLKKQLAQILAEECGQELSRVMDNMERDYWLSARDAVEYGLVDHVGYPEM